MLTVRRYCTIQGNNAHSMVMISKIIRRDVMQTLVYKERNDV